MKPLKFLITLSLLFTLTFQPLVLFAQIGGGGTVGGGGSGGSPGGGVSGGTSGGTGTGAPSTSGGTSSGTSTGAPSTSGGTYNPSSASSGTGKSFSGSNFSGIGGAVVACANVGGLLIGAVSGLFKKDKEDTKSTGTVKSVPTDAESVEMQAKKIKEEEKKNNRRQECLNGIAYGAAKTLLQQVSSKTLTWINKGLGGNPTYVQDITSQLQTVRDEKLQTYLDGAQNSNSIFGNALRSTITQQTTGLTDGYLNKVMNTPEARQYDAFQKNFSSGGWGALLNMNNNPIGATFNSAEKLQKTIDVDQESLTNEVQRNNGFLDMRECVEYEKIKPSNTPGANTGPTCNGGVPRDELPPTVTCIPDRVTDTSSTSGSNKLECLRYRTVTPGSLISNQAQNILGSPTRQLEMADSINEILGAFFDQVLNGLITDGLASLQNRKNSKNNNFGGLGQNLVLGTNGLRIGSSGASDVFGYQLPGNGYDVQEFDISRPQMLRAITQAQYDYLNRAKDSQIAMRSIVPNLGALDYCIPGPNPTWESGLNDNFQTFMAGFEIPTKGRTFGNKLLVGFLTNDPGGGLGIIAQIFNLNSEDKVLNYMLVGAAELFDKATGGIYTTGLWKYEYYTSDYSRPVKKVGPEWVRQFIVAGYQRVVEKYRTNFADDKIIALFKAVDPDQKRATGNVRESIKETAKLSLYNETITSLDEDYKQVISDKEDTIAELEDIRAEALTIVKNAKARHIAEQAAAGTPLVGRYKDPITGADRGLCIDNAYVIDESQIKGPKREESEIPEDPIIQKTRDAKNYFYSQLQ